ncbi:hypothetical protein [Streptomyces varsoviensis]|uniref:Uncharacterized protein n=1 Tax=Streptomyces varsoviensis TaxID=67373 RepID=A0ABR5IXR1_9ACTN|nr:hypothetical protein [Streptomyces varsoviensis]KOG85918.1 hypothetical protein ADK38_33980 [Streptomyces varsoviensis]
MNDTLRLLPWSDERGKPCYLKSQSGTGRVSRLADQIEEQQLATGVQLLAFAKDMLRNRHTSAIELHFLGTRLSESLHDALRVATSRGGRLPVPEEPEDDGTHEDTEEEGDLDRGGPGAPA